MSDLVLGASQVGEDCLRKLWFISRGYREKIDKQTERIFDIGRTLEALVVKWLREDGYEVFYNQKDHNDVPDFVIPVGRGRIEGRFDAVLLKEKALVDIKTCGDRLFVRLLEGDIPKAYIMQVNLYFFGVKGDWSKGRVDDQIRGIIERVGIIGVHKASGKIHVDLFDPNVEVFREALERSVRVFNAEDYRELDPGDGCKWCSFEELCKGR